MANVITRVKEIFIEEGRRIIKFIRYGKDDVQEAEQIAPHGIDSHPIKDMVAIYADTTTLGEPVLIGYINEDQLAEMGETRLYSTNANGELQSWIWLKNNGTIEFLGNAHNLVRYLPLSSSLNALTISINTELGKIAAAIGTLGGAYVPGAVSINIADAKIEELKTK